MRQRHCGPEDLRLLQEIGILCLPTETDRHLSLHEDGVLVQHLSLIISTSHQGQAAVPYQTNIRLHLCRCQSTCCFEYKRHRRRRMSSLTLVLLHRALASDSGKSSWIGLAVHRYLPDQLLLLSRRSPLLNSLFTLRHTHGAFLTSLSPCLRLSPQHRIANREPCQPSLKVCRDALEQHRSTCSRQFRSNI